MNTYTLTACKQMGDRDPKYGASFWGEALEAQVPVMFNLMEDVAQAGDKISFEAMEPKKSAKGNDYMRLKKVKIEGKAQGYESSTTNEPVQTQAVQGFTITKEMWDELMGSIQEIKDAINPPDIDL